MKIKEEGALRFYSLYRRSAFLQYAPGSLEIQQAYSLLYFFIPVCICAFFKSFLLTLNSGILDTATYGISAYIPYDLLDGKILVAVFTVNSALINTDTETEDTGGVL